MVWPTYLVQNALARLQGDFGTRLQNTDAAGYNGATRRRETVAADGCNRPARRNVTLAQQCRVLSVLFIDFPGFPGILAVFDVLVLLLVIFCWGGRPYVLFTGMTKVKPRDAPRGSLCRSLRWRRIALIPKKPYTRVSMTVAS